MTPDINSGASSAPFALLGLECGGTKSVAIYLPGQGQPPLRLDARSANLYLLNDAQLYELFQEISAVHKGQRPPDAVAIGMAGARTQASREFMLNVAARVWPHTPCYATNDLETALAAADAPKVRVAAQVLIISGTGSCCFGKAESGKAVRYGGWGHILGDKGSGYEIGHRVLKDTIHHYDETGEWPVLGQRVLTTLSLNEPDELIGWARDADKSAVAGLAKTVFDAWHEHDRIATEIIETAAHGLAQDASDCARRLVSMRSHVQFIFTGSILTKQPLFAQIVEKALHKLWPNNDVTLLQRDGAWGAVALARNLITQGPSFVFPQAGEAAEPPARQTPKEAIEQSPTEHRNPRSKNLDQLSLKAAIKLMLDEDKRIPPAILKCRPQIDKTIQLVVKAFEAGGRLFYVGAGTSGRLGILDASECPPTFRTPPHLVQGIIAGGQTAIWRSIEGAEDDIDAGARAVLHRGVNKKDVVIGIAASGRTPFVWGALHAARNAEAATVLLCFNPNVHIPPDRRPDVVIAPDVGPEVLTGSTRLKAGTATKLVLNIITTLAMVRMGKVVSNLMIDMQPSNVKLRDRAVRIVAELTGVSRATAQARLERCNWVIKDACQRMLRRKR